MDMKDYCLENLIIDGNHQLQPPDLYKGQTLNFGKVNYFIGKNGTGKSQIVSHIVNEVRARRNQLVSIDKGLVIKYLQANRTHNIQGSRQLHADNLNEYESGNFTVESFFQFLNGSPFTKSLVEHSLNMFFHKFPQISLQGLNILMNIQESWTKKEMKKKELKKLLEEGGKTEHLEDIEEEIEVIQKRLHTLDNESDGLKEMLILLTFIYHPRVKVVIIDEIETHLHPHMINFVSDAIQEVAEKNDKQFFIITHAPTAIRLMPGSDWKYFFLRRHENAELSKVSEFSFTEDQYKNLIPYLNPYKREAFYSDTVILLEGMDDFSMFQTVSGLMKYGEYLGGGYSFFPCWGGDNLETYRDFFAAMGKDVYVVADNNIGTRTALSSAFRSLFNTDPHYIKLSKNDITEFCLNPSKLAKGKKREIMEDELRLVSENARTFRDYPEIVKIIETIVGKNPRTELNWEFIHLAKNLAHQIQVRFHDLPEWKELLRKKSHEELITMIDADPELSILWQDSVKSEFKFTFGSPWKCTFVFRSGYTQYLLEFNEKIKPADIELVRLT